jgi:CCR4-NOT transcription complex subunit 2
MSGVGGVGGVGTQAQARQAMQPNSLDDFPALPRTQGNGDGIEDRGFIPLTGLGGATQFGVRQGSLSAGRSGLVMGSGSQPSRLLDSVIQQTGNVQISDLEKKNLVKTNLSSMVTNGTPGPPTNISLSNISRPISQQAQHSSPAPGMQNPIGHSLGAQQQVQQSKLPSSLSSVDFGSNQSNSMQTSRMGETDRFGLGGLLSLIRGESGDYSMLALGQDLTQLGLDLNQPEAPLYPSFASPWADVDSKPVEPEYHLPTCYTVQNVQSLGAKVSSFSDETLFYIFYTMPRDIMQEVVAAELSSRNWRYHTALKLWLTKDNASDIRQISENAEKGIYVFFDPNAWERVRKEYVLDYTFLDHRAAPGIMGG